MTETCDDVLIIVINSFPIDGRMFFIACGSTIQIRVLTFPIPSAKAASVCPLSTERIPPLTISQIYAVVLIVSAIIPAANLEISVPPTIILGMLIPIIGNP